MNCKKILMLFVMGAAQLSAHAQSSNKELDALNQLCRQATASGDYSEAAAVCRRARFDASKLAPGSNEHIASLINEAELKVKLGNHVDAVDIYGRALQMVERKPGGGNSAEAAVLLERRAESQMARGKNYEAELILRRALEIRDKLFGPTSIKTAITRVRHADTLTILQQQFDALEQYRKALKVFEAGGIETRDRYLATRLSIAELLSRQSRREEAEVEFNRLLDDAQKPPRKSEYVIAAYDRLAWLQGLKGNVDDARGIYQREIDEIGTSGLRKDLMPQINERLKALPVAESAS